MGTFSVELEIGDPKGERFETVDVVVDTRASFAVFPAGLLNSLGVTATDRQHFVLPDGRIVENDVAQTWMRIGGRTEIAAVVFAEETARPMIGFVTLQEFGLAVDPSGRRLISVPGYLMARKVVA